MQNPNNPLSQLLTQANQAFVAQSQQVNANVQAVDHIFSTWSHHVDQVVQNIPGLQAVANDQSIADKQGRRVADAFIEKFAQGGFSNAWGITRASFLSAKPLQTMTYPTRWQVDINLERCGFSGMYHSTLSIQYLRRMQDTFPNDVFVAQGSEVTTDGKPDPSLFLLQGLLLGWRVEDKP